MGIINDKSVALGRTKLRWRLKGSITLLVTLNIAAALAIPHVVDGHIFTLTTPATQTVILAFNLALAALFLRLHRVVVKREQAEKKVLESRLDSSARYIGPANLSLEIVKAFSTSFSSVESKSEAEDVLRHLQQTIAVSVVRATASRIRIISTGTGRTVTEFEWKEDPSFAVPRISNAEIVRRGNTVIADDGFISVTSDYSRLGIACAFRAFTKNPESCDYQLLRALVNQFHLFYLLSIQLFN